MIHLLTLYTTYYNMVHDLQPESKYIYRPPTSCFGIGKLKSPMAEGAIGIATGWFKTPPRFRFKVGDTIGIVPLPPAKLDVEKKKEEEPYKLMSVYSDAKFPFSCDAERFDIIVGKLGKYLGSGGIRFLDDKDKVTMLMQLAIEESSGEAR